MSNNIENSKKSSTGVIMSIVCGVILSMGAIHMDTINWILPTIANDLAAGNSTLMVTSGFFYGMMIGHVIVGPLSDMIGKKKTMIFGFLICVIGAVIGSQSTALGGLVAARLLQGIGGAASSNAARAVGGDAGKGRKSAIDPKSISGKKGGEIMRNMIKTFVKKGGQHVQINVVDDKTLLDAQIHPEDHRNLVVRIAGYMAYFTELDKECQDNLIYRTAHHI